MTTHDEVGKLLENIHTNFWEYDKETHKPTNELGIRDFSSFLVCKKPLPLNSTILKDFLGSEDNIKPHLLTEKYHANFAFDDSFFSADKDKVFNNEYMFVALNVADRKNGDTSAWSNFHDQTMINNTYRLYLELNEDYCFRGCYITDIIKNTIDSNSGNVKRNFFLSESKKLSLTRLDGDEKRAEKLLQWDQEDEAKAMAKNKIYRRQYSTLASALRGVENNRDVFYKSAALFVAECHAIRPKKIVVFGDTAHEALKQMLVTEVFKNDEYVTNLVKHRVKIIHYAYLKKFSKWVSEESPAVAKLIDESNAV